MPLQNALALGLYCSGTGTLRRPGGRGPSLTVQDAVLEGILEPDVLTVKVAHSGEMLSLTEAVGAGLLDPIAGTVLDTECNITVDLYEAMGRGLVLPVAKVLPLLEIVLRSFYSPVTGLICSPFCERPQCLRDAVRSGFVNTGSTMVFSGSCLMPFSTAVDCGLVDDRAGVLRVLGGPMDFKLAFERCHLLDISPPLNLKMALSLGLFDDQSGHWMDPASGCMLTLADALEQRLLDDTSTRVLQSKDDTRRTLVLSEALSQGKIDQDCSKYVTEDGALIPLVSCFKEGLVLNVQPSTPLQRLIREGCYLETSNRFSLRGLSHTVSLGEVVMRRLVDPFLPFLPQPGQEPMHLMEACRLGLIELSLGLLMDGQQLVPLVKALETGLVIDLEKPLTLVEAVQLGFCDPDSGRLLHPVEGSYLNLEEALELGIVTTRDSYVKDAETGQFLTFARAVESGVVDPVRNRYTPRDLNLYKAVFTKLIIYAKMPLSLGQAFADELFDEDSGKFLDPRSSELLGFKDALSRGLLDRHSMLQESAASAFRASRGAVTSRDGPSFSLSTQAGSAENQSQLRSGTEIGNLQRGMKTSDRTRTGVTPGFVPSIKQPIEPSIRSGVSLASRQELTSSKGTTRAQSAIEKTEKLKFPLQRQIVQETVLAAEMLPIIKAEQELQPCPSSPVKEQSSPSGSTTELMSTYLKDSIEPILAVLAPSKSLLEPHFCVLEKLTSPIFKTSAEIHDPTFASREVAVLSPKTRQIRFHSMPSLQFTSFAAIGIPLYSKSDNVTMTNPLQEKHLEPGQLDVIGLAGNGTDHNCKAAISDSSGIAVNVPSPSQDDHQYSDKAQQPSTTEVIVKDTNDETAKDFDLPEPTKAVCKVAFHTEYDRATHVTKVQTSPSTQLAGHGCAGKATRRQIRNQKKPVPDDCKDDSEQEYPLDSVEMSLQEHSVVVHVETANDGVDAVRVEIAENRPYQDDWQRSGSFHGATSSAVVHLQQNFGAGKAGHKDSSSVRKKSLLPSSLVELSPGFNHGKSSLQLSSDALLSPETCISSSLPSLELISAEARSGTDQMPGTKREMQNPTERPPTSGQSTRIKCHSILQAQPLHPQPVSFDTILSEGSLCPKTGQVTDEACSSTFTLLGASKHGFLDQSSFLVKDTLGKRLLSLQDAIQEGILDMETGTVLAATECGHISFGDALARHIFVTPCSPLSLAEALEYGLYRPAEGLLLCPWTGHWLPVTEQQQLPSWIDQSAEGSLPLTDSKARGLADPQASRPQADRSRTVLFHPTQDRVRGLGCGQHCTLVKATALHITCVFACTV
ncbi:uncharacterized protein [Dermacentor andersoni]|uniref:uncharacterized protein n=1 Tax=Dermacentor andersoni TaxID=34620 RepID=UPI003B3B72E6